MTNYKLPSFFFEAIVKPLYTSFEFASTTSNYRKFAFRTDSGINYTTGAFYCSSELFTITQILKHMSNITFSISNQKLKRYILYTKIIFVVFKKKFFRDW